MLAHFKTDAHFLRMIALYMELKNLHFSFKFIFPAHYTVPNKATSLTPPLQFDIARFQNIPPNKFSFYKNVCQKNVFDNKKYKQQILFHFLPVANLHLLVHSSFFLYQFWFSSFMETTIWQQIFWPNFFRFEFILVQQS